jgi:hypothetical protein
MIYGLIFSSRYQREQVEVPGAIAKKTFEIKGSTTGTVGTNQGAYVRTRTKLFSTYCLPRTYAPITWYLRYLWYLR